MGKNRKKKEDNDAEDDRYNYNVNDVNDYDYDNGNNNKKNRFDVSKPQFKEQKHNIKTSGGGNRNNKVVLDKRFASVLTDERFQLNARDKYGRSSSSSANKKRRKNRAKEELSAFYTIEEEEEDGTLRQDEGEGEKNDGRRRRRPRREKDKKHDNKQNLETGGDDEDINDDDDSDRESDGDQQQQQQPSSRIAYLTALSRGEIDVSSSSSSSSSSDDDDESSRSSSSDNDETDDDDEKLDGEDTTIGILDPSGREEEDAAISWTNEESPYLAVQNMDWSRVRAVDIFAILSSFTTPAAAGGGGVKRVRVYTSDFGLERLAQERRYGLPTDLWKKEKLEKKKANNDEDGDDDSSNDDSSSSKDDDDGGGNAKPSVEGVEEDDDSSEDPSTGGDSAEDEAIDDLVGENSAAANGNAEGESDFDPEKLRAYEASKLKYYFAVVEFADPRCADAVYREVDGLEFEHSSAAVDLRSIPDAAALADAIRNRPMRDEATRVPSNYDPPAFVVSALQQSNVECTWEAGDPDRERDLTRYYCYGSGQQHAWESMAESDDLRAYLASDASSDEDDDHDEKDGKSSSRRAKAKKMRALLGLDSDNDDDIGANSDMDDPGAPPSSPESSGDDEEEDEDDGEAKEVRFIPGRKKLEDSIRTKLETKDDRRRDPTPWEKYTEKRKEKRRERRQAARAKRKEVNELRKQGAASGQYAATAGVAAAAAAAEKDSFFADGASASSGDGQSPPEEPFAKRRSQTREELELLVAGGEQDDEDEERRRDYDMRGLERIEKNKDKKLRGSRKRKESSRAASVSGTDFTFDVKDERFRAVLDGEDDRFGIDRTDPQYKETAAMKQILTEQTKRRKEKRRKRKTTSTALAERDVLDVPDVVNAEGGPSSGASSLSALVRSIKSKVKNQ